MVRALVISAVVGTLLAGAGTAHAAAAGSLAAQVDSSVVSANETFTLTVTLTLDNNAPVEEFKLPDTGAFQVLSTNRSEGSTVQIGGGRTLMRRTVRIQISLLAKKPGRWRIGAGSARVGGEEVRSEPVLVNVLPPGSTPRPRGATPPPAAPAEPEPLAPPEDAAGLEHPHGLPATPAMLRSGLFATLETDKEHAVLGEQVTLTVRLFSRMDLTDIDAMRLPKLEGFWSEEMESPRRISPTPVVLDGQRYQSYLLRRMAVFPTRAGEFELPAVQADVVVGGSFFSAGERRSAFSLPLKLSVDPLPAENQPPNFNTGNVGQFALEARLDKTRISRSQPATLTIRVRGTGNLRQLAVPALPPTPEIRVFDPTPSEELAVKNGRYAGTKTLEYLLQPKRAGRLQLPEIRLDFYDPEAGTYVTRTAAHLVLDVVEDDATTAQGATPRGNVLAVQARPIRAEAAPGSALRPPRSHPALPVLLGAPLLLALGSLGAGGMWRRRRERRSADRSVAARQATRALQEAAKSSAGPEAVSAALGAYLDARLGSAVLGLTRAELRARLGQRRVQANDVDRVVQLLDRLDEARYAPGGSARTAALADEAVAAVRALESALAEAA